MSIFGLHNLLMLLNKQLELAGVCTDELRDLLTTLKENKGGHGAHCILLSDTLEVIDIDFDKHNVRVLLGHLCQLRCNEFAWTAPLCKKVDDDKLFACSIQLVTEFFFLFVHIEPLWCELLFLQEGKKLPSMDLGNIQSWGAAQRLSWCF
jgi:hypothetical protein